MKTAIMAKVPAALQSTVSAQYDAAEKQLINKWFGSNDTQQSTPDFHGDLNALFQQFGAMLGMQGLTLDSYLASLGDKGAQMAALLKGLSAQQLTDYAEEGKTTTPHTPPRSSPTVPIKSIRV